MGRQVAEMSEPGAITEKNGPVRSIAYLVSRYPTLSMIFVLREVVALRGMGFRIETASINRPDRAPEDLTEVERSEAERTYCVKEHGIPGAVSAHLRTFAGTPRGYLRGVWLAVRLAELDLGRQLLNLAYFTEGLMVGVWMWDQKIKHLHVHLASQAASVGLFTQRVFGVGYSLTVHGPDEFYDVEGQYLTEKIAAVDFAVCISSYTESQLMKLSPYSDWKKFEVVRLGVDLKQFGPVVGDEVRDDFEILCVGRLTPAKGQHLLIDAVDRLARQGRRARLRLVGGGPNEGSLRACAARIGWPEAVVFEGPVNQDRIREFYARADAFCLPSFAEGLPVVLMEAMAMGIPTVSTYIAGIPELIRDGVDGLLVPAADVDALVGALGRLMESMELRERLGAAGRERVREGFELGANVERLAEVFWERVGD